jgi:hypothetical protein
LASLRAGPVFDDPTIAMVLGGLLFVTVAPADP